MEVDFRYCTRCGHTWPSRDEFLDDPAVKLIGYQAAFRELRTGLFLFNHSCGTTLALPVDIFADLYDGPIFEERHTGLDDCPGYCGHKEDLNPCTAQCECAFVREIIRIIRDRRPATSR